MFKSLEPCAKIIYLTQSEGSTFNLIKCYKTMSVVSHGPYLKVAILRKFSFQAYLSLGLAYIHIQFIFIFLSPEVYGKNSPLLHYDL